MVQALTRSQELPCALLAHLAPTPLALGPQHLPAACHVLQGRTPLALEQQLFVPHVLLAPTTQAQGLHSAHLVRWGPTYLELEPLQLPAASPVSLGPTPPALVLLLFALSAALVATTLALGPRCAHLVQWGPTVWELEPPQLPAASPVSPGPTPPALVPLLFAPHAPQAPTTLALGLRCALHAALAPTPLEQQPAAPCALLGPTSMALALPSAPSAARAPTLLAQGPPSAARAALAPTSLAQVQVLARHALQAPTSLAPGPCQQPAAAAAALALTPPRLGLPFAARAARAPTPPPWGPPWGPPPTAARWALVPTLRRGSAPQATSATSTTR